MFVTHFGPKMFWSPNGPFSRPPGTQSCQNTYLQAQNRLKNTCLTIWERLEAVLEKNMFLDNLELYSS